MCWPPPASAVAVTPTGSCVSTGVELAVVVPSPSSPSSLLPQHFTPPALITAQVCSQPDPIAFTPLSSPTTGAGSLLQAFGNSPQICGPLVVPRPSRPSAL